MRYAAVSTEKEITANVVHKNFAFLEYACSVYKTSVYHGLRTHIIETSIYNRGGEQSHSNYLYKSNI